MTSLHQRLIHSRRVTILAEHFAPLIPVRASLLDVGSGDGRLGAELRRRRPDVDIRGIDVLTRPRTHIPVDIFDGITIPFAECSFDVVMFVDVLHHTLDPLHLLREAARVTRRLILIKDHCRQGLMATPTLRLMDFVGNFGYGVALPYNYWSLEEWHRAFSELDLCVTSWQDELGLYPTGSRWLFERSLHFVSALAPPTGEAERR